MENGNLVQFGPENHHNIIKNIAAGRKLMLRRKGRSYVMKVEFVKWIPGSATTFQGQAK